jgi:hypothetical protein
MVSSSLPKRYSNKLRRLRGYAAPSQNDIPKNVILISFEYKRMQKNSQFKKIVS